MDIERLKNGRERKESEHCEKRGYQKIVKDLRIFVRFKI